MAKSFTTESIRLENVRLSFPVIYKPKAFSPGQEPRFQASFLLDPTNEGHKAILSKLKSEAMRIGKEAFGVTHEGKLPPEVKVCIYNGNTKSYDGYKDMMVVSTSNTTRPTVVNRARQPVAEGEPQAPYAGCYVNATITLWTQNNQYGKRINANLRAIQFVQDGAAFGRAPVDAEDEFEPLEGAAPAGANGTAAGDFDF